MGSQTLANLLSKESSAQTAFWKGDLSIVITIIIIIMIKIGSNSGEFFVITDSI